MRRVRVITVAVKSSKYYVFWVCVCSCNAHAPYCHLRPLQLYNIFSHITS